MKQFTSVLVLAILLLSANLKSQTLGEFKPKDTSYGLGKLKGNASKIYISSFNVIYQVYNEKQDFKQGGSVLGGGYRGDAMAEASIGLDGLTDKDVQRITDQLYVDYITQLKSKGLTVLTGDDAAKTETYSDYTRMQGGTVSLAQYPGTMTTAPTGYDYFVKKVDKSGKTKSGGFLNQASMLYPKLSKELGDAIIAEVNMFVLFVEDKNAFKGNGANIKIATNLRLAGGAEAIIMTDDAKFKFKGQNTVSVISSGVNFYHGKMGMGATTSYSGTLSKSLGIGSVIEDTKVQSFANRSADILGTKTIYGTFFTPDNKSSAASKVVAVDPEKYYTGVYNAAKKFMDHHTQQFLSGF